MTRLTRTVMRFRWIVLGTWLVILLAGGYSSSRLSDLLSNTFTVPGTDSEQARSILQHRFGDRSDGEFLVVFKVPSSTDTALKGKLEDSLAAAAKLVPSGEATPLSAAGKNILYGSILSQLTIAKAKGYTGPLLAKLRETPGATAYVTGAGRDPARPRPDLLERPEAGRVDRAPDRADRPRRRVRNLVRRHDAVPVRGLHDHRARSGSCTSSRSTSRRRPTSRTSCS